MAATNWCYRRSDFQNLLIMRYLEFPYLWNSPPFSSFYPKKCRFLLLISIFSEIYFSASAPHFPSLFLELVFGQLPEIFLNPWFPNHIKINVKNRPKTGILVFFDCFWGRFFGVAIFGKLWFFKSQKSRKFEFWAFFSWSPF